jgi:enamine deaminase RidA (YjgF/YER057c/UK114 family)
MNERRNFGSGGKWESIVGYSRVVRVGNRVYVSGTTAADNDGNIVGPNDAYAQTVRAILNVENALKQAGGHLENVVRTRMFVTDISRWEEYARAHGEFFRDVRPCATMVEIRRLIHPDMLIEIEADAEV